MDGKKNGGLKEVWRKFLVSIKRRPQMIPLAVLTVAFVFYSMKLMYISDTTAKIQGSGMGRAGFATMLFSMLSFMCFMNAFPYRKKVNVPMLVLMFVMFGIIIFSDLYYIRAIFAAINRAENPIVVTTATAYIAYAEWYLEIHIGILCVAILLILLLPVYTKQLRKIKTSIDVGDNGSMGTLDLSSEV